MARSPSVEAFERDNTLNPIVIGASGAAVVIDASWGQVGIETQVPSIDDLIANFAKPNNRNYEDWFSAHNFLNYSSNLYVLRIVDEATALNAGVAPTSAPASDDPLFEPKGVLFNNATHFEQTRGVATQYFAARYAGALGNSLQVSIADAATFDTWKYKNNFDTAPNSSVGSEVSVADANDEIHVVVIDRLGLFTRVKGQVLETYSFLTKSKDGKNMSGNNSYYINAINRSSQYIYAVNPLGDALMADTTDKTSWGGELYDGKPFAELKEAFDGILGGGVDGDKPSKADYIAGYETFESIEDENLNMIISASCGGDANHAEVANAILDMCLRTKRFVGFISPKSSDVVNVTKTAAVTNIELTHGKLTSLHSYGHMSTSYKFQYDKFNDVYRWVAGNADDAGLYARTHNDVGKFASAAGYNRGKYANTVSLAFSPDKTARDRLYKLGINPVIAEKGEGIVLLGDRTLQPKNSAFSFLGTRFLFIDLRLTITRSAKYNLFEFNDEFTRAQFRDSIEPVLRDMRGKRGIVDFKIVCDESNNPVSVVQKGEFIGDIYIKPQYSIQYIILNFNAVDQGVNFEEFQQAA